MRSSRCLCVLGLAPATIAKRKRLLQKAQERIDAQGLPGEAVWTNGLGQPTTAERGALIMVLLSDGSTVHLGSPAHWAYADHTRPQQVRKSSISSTSPVMSAAVASQLTELAHAIGEEVASEYEMDGLEGILARAGYSLSNPRQFNRVLFAIRSKPEKEIVWMFRAMAEGHNITDAMEIAERNFLREQG